MWHSLAWRNAVNDRLRRATGYHIVKVRSAPARPAPVRPAPPRRARPRPTTDRIRSFHDDEARATMRAVRPWTMTSHAKVFALIVAVRYLADHRVPGEMVECGVWRGGSMQAVARTLLDRGVTDRDLHLFDTFEGMPPPTTADRRAGQFAGELLASSPRDSHLWAIAGLDDVRAGMSQTSYPAERIHYHPGLVEDTIPAQAPERIALLRLDTDWYQSTGHELTQLYDRVTPGGVIVFDDYDYWEGAGKAVDEFLAVTGHRLLLAPMDSGRIAVKP